MARERAKPLSSEGALNRGSPTSLVMSVPIGLLRGLGAPRRLGVDDKEIDQLSESIKLRGCIWPGAQSPERARSHSASFVGRRHHRPSRPRPEAAESYPAESGAGQAGGWQRSFQVHPTQSRRRRHRLLPRSRGWRTRTRVPSRGRERSNEPSSCAPRSQSGGGRGHPPPPPNLPWDPIGRTERKQSPRLYRVHRGKWGIG
jgi:hypothetical protein